MHDSGPVLVAGAPLRWTRPLAALAEAAELLLAADGGTDHLARLGLRPRWVIGDLDSISAPTRNWVGEDRMVHRTDQSRSDLAKALVFALDDLELPRLTVIGALDGRADHTVANLGLLAGRAMGDRLVFRMADALVMAVRGEAALPAVAGETWSFWTFDPRARVTITGVRWPVRDEPLDPGRPCSLSNLAEGDRIEVATEGGAVVVQRFLGEVDEGRS